MKKIIQDFDQVPIRDIKKPRVGVVGEILVKYSPTANNDVVRLLEAEGAEAVVPDIVGFMNYSSTIRFGATSIWGWRRKQNDR